MTILLDYGVELVTRAEWDARPATSIKHLDASFGATRHWEGPHMGDFPHQSCPAKVRGIQNYHMDSKGWTDIAYTGVVCPHGYVYEGRGLLVRTAANGTTEGNETAYAFCYLGGEGDPFTEAGKCGMKAAMNWTRAHGGAGAGRNDHNDWKSTQCPGTDIEAWGDGGEPVTTLEEAEDMPLTESDLNAIHSIVQDVTEQRLPLIIADDITNEWYVTWGGTKVQVTKDDAQQLIAEGSARYLKGTNAQGQPWEAVPIPHDRVVTRATLGVDDPDV